MMNIRKLTLSILSTFAIHPLAYGEDGLYLGLQGGIVANDDAGFDDATVAGLALGYEFLGLGIADVAVEGVYTTTVDEGDAPDNGKWDIDTIALFGTLRTAGPIYLIARAGALHQQLDAGAASTDDTGLAAGLGVGASLALAQIELQYTRLEEDLDYLGLTVNIKTPF